MMLGLIILAWVNGHQGGETADPALLDWIKHWLDGLVGLEPWTVVAMLGLLIVVVPLFIMLFYVAQRRRTGNTH
jgi:hypothetical protein